MSKEIISVEKLCVSYKNVKAVQDLSFSLEEGQILAIIGPNGSGKTSTVECLEGLRKPNGGNVSVLGLNPWLNRSELYKQVGIQLQETEYPSKIKVCELCELFASFYDNPADWELLLKQLDLNEKRKRLVRKLSGGERQRLSILLSLMPRPRLLMLDELTTGLDPEARQSMWQSLVSIRKSGASIVMVSHYLDEVEALADRILYLENGKSLFSGTQEEFRQYAKQRLSESEWQEGLSLEKLYLMLSPKTKGITLEGISV